ncbi:MAG TPA: tRNA (adenosine(37)-N6)-threonylcarbamoyltransferase complex dimerization subunit type 1 TsaB [Trebonia sp.]|nr:tRNA (adenosine(37)-N6)-threonylcarbamoyltransferase complex dimerization subunit type 1 TsaB [Trebonia sp.]
MLLLGLDTATPAVTVALHDGTRVLAQATTVDKRRQAELLMPAIAQVLDEAGAERADLTAIAVGVGPGPYTGLRVGLVTARVLGSALGIPVHGACSLDIIAADVTVTAGTGRRFLVATDARRREVYYARYDEAGRLAGPLVDRPADVAGRDALPAVGEGAWLYRDLFEAVEGPQYPAAATLARVVAAELGAGSPGQSGRRVPLLAPEPLYLRRPDAREPGAPKRVTGTPPPSRPRGPARGGA